MKRKKMNVMILPVGTFCNLACGYCYHLGGAGREMKVMPEDILRKVIQDSGELAENIDFYWHGGEPLLAGIKFYEGAARIQNSITFSGRIRNIIQTNATLIDDDWIDFFLRNNFLVGVSIDGPELLHDSCRVNKEGRGTYNEVVSGVKKIQEKGKNVGCITLITKFNVRHPEDVWNTIRTLKIPNLALHFCARTRWGNSDNLMPEKKEILGFCKKLFDLWTKEDDPHFRIRNFVNVVRTNFGARPLDCAHQFDACKFFIAINHEGNVFPCHRFANDVTKSIGNISSRKLAEILESAEEIYSKMSVLPKDCQKCGFLKACGNGCAHERLMANGSFNTENPNCWIIKNLNRYVQRWVNVQKSA